MNIVSKKISFNELVDKVGFHYKVKRRYVDCKVVGYYLQEYLGSGYFITEHSINYDYVLLNNFFVLRVENHVEYPSTKLGLMLAKISAIFDESIFIKKKLLKKREKLNNIMCDRYSKLSPIFSKNDSDEIKRIKNNIDDMTSLLSEINDIEKLFEGNSVSKFEDLDNITKINKIFEQLCIDIKPIETFNNDTIYCLSLLDDSHLYVFNSNTYTLHETYPIVNKLLVNENEGEIKYSFSYKLIDIDYKDRVFHLNVDEVKSLNSVSKISDDIFVFQNLEEALFFIKEKA